MKILIGLGMLFAAGFVSAESVWTEVYKDEKSSLEMRLNGESIVESELAISSDTNETLLVVSCSLEKNLRVAVFLPDNKHYRADQVISVMTEDNEHSPFHGTIRVSSNSKNFILVDPDHLRMKTKRSLMFINKILNGKRNNLLISIPKVSGGMLQSYSSEALHLGILFIKESCE